jgi:hypothetical protein
MAIYLASRRDFFDKLLQRGESSGLRSDVEIPAMPLGNRDARREGETMRRSTFLAMMLALAAAALLAPSALAEPRIISVDPRDERYAFCEVDEGFLRMDKQSGQVSLCRPREGGGWICQLVPDDRASYEREISRLQSQVGNLKQAMGGQDMPAEPPVTVPAAPAPRLSGDQTEVLPRSDQAQPAPGGDAGSDVKLSEPPSQTLGKQEAERMTVLERAWLRLIEMMVNLQRELQKKS